MAKANGVRWYRHYLLRRDDEHVLRKVLEFEVRGKRKPRRPNKTWKMQVENESKSVGLEKKDARNRARWRMGVCYWGKSSYPRSWGYTQIKIGLMMMRQYIVQKTDTNDNLANSLLSNRNNKNLFHHHHKCCHHSYSNYL